MALAGNERSYVAAPRPRVGFEAYDSPVRTMAIVCVWPMQMPASVTTRIHATTLQQLPLRMGVSV